MKINRSEVLRDAHRRWRNARARGWDKPWSADRWTWGRCLSLAWAAARQRRDDVEAYHAAPIVRRRPAQSWPVEAAA